MHELKEARTLCFWDVDIDKLDRHTHKDFIISRLIEYGTEKSIRLMKDHYSDDEIGHVVRKSRMISRKTAFFWSMVLNIPKEEVWMCAHGARFPNPPDASLNN